MIINNKRITATHFAFDGCHKFYLLHDLTEQTNAKENGYGVYPIKDLPEKFWNSCPLRFVSHWSACTEHIVEQCVNKVVFILDDGSIIDMDFANDCITKR